MLEVLFKSSQVLSVEIDAVFQRLQCNPGGSGHITGIPETRRRRHLRSQFPSVPFLSPSADHQDLPTPLNSFPMITSFSLTKMLPNLWRGRLIVYWGNFDRVCSLPQPPRYRMATREQRPVCI